MSHNILNPWPRRLKIRWIFNVVGRYGDHYEWNKVVTCIHNVLSQQRYLEHYGEVTIRNLKSNVCTCKITFVKVAIPLVVYKSGLFSPCLTNMGLSRSHGTGAQRRTRTRCREQCWIRVGASYTALVVYGTRASSATLCPHQSVSGSQVSV